MPDPGVESFTIESCGVRIGVESVVRGVRLGFEDLFPYRYLPSYRLSGPGGGDAVVEWLEGGEAFQVDRVLLGDVDRYLVRGAAPGAYVNESPYFFVLQVMARALEKRGALLLTDSASFHDPETGRTVLLLGYPHAGKSTILAIAASRGYIPLSTENTVAVVEDGLRIVGGSRVLVVDPYALELYRVELRAGERTRHGYLVLDLRSLEAPARPRVDEMYLVYCSFNSHGVGARPVKGRKILKTLWYFASATIRGLDYYEPHPPNLSDPALDARRASLLARLSEEYGGGFMEVFGSHVDVLNYMAGRKG